MFISEVMEQVLERNIPPAKVTADFSILAFVLVFLHLIFNAFMGAAGIAILAGHLQSQIPHDPSQVFALDSGLGFAIFHRANRGVQCVDIIVLSVLDFDSVAEGTGECSTIPFGSQFSFQHFNLKI